MPIRFIAESFGYNVEWNQEDKTIIITEMLAENDNKEVVSIVGDNNADSKNEVQSDSNTLIVYFSRTGTTKDLAEKIHNKIGGDIAEIVPVNPYPEDYNQCVDQAQEEINADARPEYTVSIDNITKYDTILVGYPIWWSSVPPVVRTFLDNSDLSDKTIMPFCTHGGSGISGSMSDIKKLCADSNITDGLDESSDDKVDAWLENNGL